VAGVVGVRGDLPAGEVDGAEAGLDLLHGLVAGEGAKGVGVLAFLVLLGELLPQLLGAAAGQGVLLGDAAAEADDVGSLVVPGDTFPARVGSPLELQGGGLLFGRLLGGLKCCSHLCLLGGVRDRFGCFLAVQPGRSGAV
jgi:hypothetical protein